MFISKKELKEIKDEILELKNPYIGEVYCAFKWYKFRNLTIVDEVNGYIKIKISMGMLWAWKETIWVKNEDIIYYKDIYKSLKAKVEKRHNKKPKGK